MVTWSKTRIVEEALQLGVDFETWAAGGGQQPCGVRRCRIRDAALRLGRPDLCS